MAGHDDVYALLLSGYTILFGSNPQEAADLAAISYRLSALSLIPVANAMDGFATSHMLSEALMPEPELLREFLGDPAGRITCPTVAQEMLFGAKGRVFQLRQYLAPPRGRLRPERPRGAARLPRRQRGRGRDRQRGRADRKDARLGSGGASRPVAAAMAERPREGHAPARPGARRCPQSGPDRRRAEPARLPGRLGRPPHPFRPRRPAHRPRGNAGIQRAHWAANTRPIKTYMCDDAETVMIGLGSVTDDVQAVATYLAVAGQEGRRDLGQAPAAVPGSGGCRGPRRQEGCHRAGALRRHRADAPWSLRPCSRRARTSTACVTPAFRRSEKSPKVTTAIFGLGAHDLQPRHLIAAYKNMEKGAPRSSIWARSSSPRTRRRASPRCRRS